MKEREVERLKAAVLEAGFDFAGLSPPGRSPRAGAFLSWLAEGRHADMAWLARDPERRLDPARLAPGTGTVLVAGVSYFVRLPPPALLADPRRGRIAAYAWGPDYHDVLGGRLAAAAAAVRGILGPSAVLGCFADTRPLLERDAAERAGLGFTGRHTQFIRPGAGSMCFLGGLLLGPALPPGRPRGAEDPAGCGTCTRCLAACPTRALDAPYRIDSRRCVSYLTVEHRGAIPPGLRPGLGRRLFGCDACQEVCPWVRRFSRPAARPFLAFEEERDAPRLEEAATLDRAAFRQRYRGTPVWRATWAGFRRNAAVAMGNSGLPEFAGVLSDLARDREPLVAEHAQWALDRLAADRAAGGPAAPTEVGA